MSTKATDPDVIVPAAPKYHLADEPETVPIIDPSATIDPQTGAIIEKKTKTERLFVARLDAVLLVYCCVSQVLK